MYPPSFGQSDVVVSVSPMVSATGIIPHPYVTNGATSAIAALSSGGTVTKWNGAGPRQYQTSPRNRRSMRRGYARPRETERPPSGAEADNAGEVGRSVGFRRERRTVDVARPLQSETPLREQRRIRSGRRRHE